MMIKPKTLRDWAKDKGMKYPYPVNLWDAYCAENPGTTMVYESLGIVGDGDKVIATAKDVRAWARQMGLTMGKSAYVPVHVWDLYLETYPEAHN